MAKANKKSEKPVAGKTNTWGLVSLILIILLVASVAVNIFLAIKLPKETANNVKRSSTSSQSQTNNTPSHSKKTPSHSSSHSRLTDRKARSLLEAQRKKSNYSWTIDDVDVEACNSDNTICLVEYDQVAKDGTSTDDLQVLMQYKNGKWTFELPGTTKGSVDYYSKYNLVEIDD